MSQTNHIKQQILSFGLFIVLFTIVLLEFSTSFAQSVPQLVNYQGMLTDASGQPLATQEYNISFSIHTAATSGTAVWGPQIFDGAAGTGHGAKVPVVQGHFNVILGPVDVDGDSILDAFVTEETYLEITVNGGSPITPRQRILSTPYAVQAEKAAFATHLSNIIPSGTIVMWSGALADIPNGWALCDGNNGTPNLQNRFIVAAGAEYNVGESGGSDSHEWWMIEERSGVDGHHWVANYLVVDGTDILGVHVTVDNRPRYYALAFIMKL